MSLSDKIDKLNRSKRAQAWGITLVNYLFVVLVLTGNNPLGEGMYEGIGYLFVLSSIYLTYLHIKAWITGKDVFEHIDFDLIGSEEELKESETTKKIKKILIKGTIWGLILLVIGTVIYSLSVYLMYA